MGAGVVEPTDGGFRLLGAGDVEPVDPHLIPNRSPVVTCCRPGDAQRLWIRARRPQPVDRGRWCMVGARIDSRRGRLALSGGESLHGRSLGGMAGRAAGIGRFCRASRVAGISRTGIRRVLGGGRRGHACRTRTVRRRLSARVGAGEIASCRARWRGARVVRPARRADMARGARDARHQIETADSNQTDTKDEKSPDRRWLHRPSLGRDGNYRWLMRRMWVRRDCETGPLLAGSLVDDEIPDIGDFIIHCWFPTCCVQPHDSR